MLSPPEVVLVLWVAVGVVTAAFFIERLLHVVLALMSAVATGRESKGAYPGMQIVGVCVSFWVSAWASLFKSVAYMFRSLFWVFVWWLVIFLFGIVVFISYETMPDVVRGTFGFWNDYLGPILNHHFFWPLRLVQAVVNQVLPVFNLVVAINVHLLQAIVFTGLQTQPVEVLIGIGESIGSMMGRLGSSIMTYALAMNNVVYNCESIGQQCYEPLRLQLMPALEKVPPLVSFVATALKGMCPAVLFPLDIVLYPLMDPNFLNAIDSVLHSLNLLLVETPRITVQRCKAFRGRVEAQMMCLPDIRPIFDELMKAVRQVGFGFDNWLDMSLVIIEAASTGEGIECYSEGQVQSIRAYGGVFGLNMTTIVGVAPSLVAITDGVVIQWVDSERTNGDALSQFGAGWPIEIDVSLGVAAVSLPTGRDARGEGSGLLGCRCDDGHDDLMHITCAVAPHFESSLSQQVFSVGFEVPSTSEYMTCRASKISVQSVRWPSTRYTTLSPGAEPVGQNKVDAAIWVSPLCSTGGAVGAECLGGEGLIFKRTSCFPYCLALHERASISQDLVLFSSSTWESYVHLMARDCTMAKVGKVPGRAESKESDAITYTGGSYYGGADLKTTAAWNGEGEGWGGCVANPMMRTLIPKDRHPGGYAAANTDGFNSVRLEDQPFVFAGDLALIGEYNYGNDDTPEAYAVTVVRIVGNSVNEYTLRKIVGSAPANPPLDMHNAYLDPPTNCEAECEEGDERYEKGRLTLPYRFQTTAFVHNPGVQTARGIFYAQNPSLQMFTAMFEFCSPVKTKPFPRAQLAIMSSYAPIQITRLVVDERQNTLGAVSIRVPGALTEAFSGGSFTPVRGKDKNRGDTEFCKIRFHMAVSRMEYIDDLNIAVVVMNATLESAELLGEGVTYDVWYLNPQTMEFREEAEGMYSAPRPHKPSDSAVALCPAMRRMPNLGSLAAEAAVAVLFLVRFVPETVLGFIGMAPVWRSGTDCPLLSSGHSQLERCGAEMLSWDDFFRAVYNSNRHAWRSLAFLAQFLTFRGSSGVKNVLLGMNYFGAGMMRPMIARGPLAVVSVMRVPLLEKVPDAGMAMIQMSPHPLLATFKSINGNPIGGAWWVSNVVSSIIMDIIPPAVRGDAGAAFRSIYMNMYESQGSFKELVLADGHLGCHGLSVMMGLNNPWAELILNLCQYPLQATQGMLEFALTLFVDVAFTGCLCVQSSGSDFYEYAMRECYTNAPKHLQPLIIRWLQFGEARPEDVCREMRTLMQDKINRSMDPAFSSLMKAADALGSSLDYLTFMFDTSAGQCLDFDTDPYVVVILPEPVDYFRACGLTSLCGLRCKGEISAFERLVAEGGVLSAGFDEYSQEVQSNFFVGTDADSEAPFKIVLSLKEVTCVGLSEAADCKGRCVAVLGVKWSLGEGSVRRYCVPEAPGQGVYLVSEWVLGSGAAVAKWSLGRIVDDTARIIVLVIIEDEGYGALQIAREGFDGSQLVYWKQANTEIVGLKQVSELFIHGAAAWIKVLVRQEEGRSYGIERFYCACTSVALRECKFFKDEGFSGGKEDFFTVTSGYNVIFLGDDVANAQKSGELEVLLVPSQPGTQQQDLLNMKVTLFAGWNAAKVAGVSVIGYSKSFTVDAGVMEYYGMIFEQKQYAEGSVRLAQNGNSVLTKGKWKYEMFSSESPGALVAWLANVVVGSSSASDRVSVARRHSQGAYVGVKVERRCDKTSCTGCVSLDVQRICYAMTQCMIARCVGTMVNQRRPLCGIGMTMRNVLAFVVEQSRGMWSILTETMADILGLGFGDREVNIEWPDDAFYSGVCVVKDGLATAISGVTSAVNNMAHSAMSVPIGYTQQGAQHVDPNLGVFMTMVLTALNNLLFQLLLYPLYVYITLQKMVICEANSVMAFTDVVGLSVTIGKADIQNARRGELSKHSDPDVQSSLLVGQCVTERTATDITNMRGLGMKQAVAAVAESLLASSKDVISNLAVRSLTGGFDATMAWMLGVITGVMDVSQTVDMAKCKMPDFYMRDVFKCGCNDFAVTIPAARRTETAVNSAFWCSGVLRMLSPMGEEILVYNKYSLQALSDLMEQGGGIDKYLLCVSRPTEFESLFPGDKADDCERWRPEFSDIRSQGVETMAVWSRCKANYQAREWDPGAYATFNHWKVERYVLMGLEVDGGPKECLLTAHERGDGNKVCLQEHLQRLNMRSEEYFSYEKAPDALQRSSVWTDACQVFTGPAGARDMHGEELKDEDGEVLTIFKACLDDYDDDGCAIAPFVWSARSTNRVPVAAPHALVITDETKRQKIGQVMIDAAWKMVQEAFNRSEIRDYNNSEIDAVLFSVEGDFLHQVFDCAIVGAMGKLDLWPSGGLGTLPVPSWWRNPDGSRDIPTCSSDDNAPPFTCGSPTRKGVIKDFVRRYFSNEKGSQATNEAVRKKISALVAAWDDKSKYVCKCGNTSTHLFSCCDGKDTDSFTPPQLRGDFGEIESADVAEQIVKVAAQYWPDLQGRIEPWWEQVDTGARAEWMWSEDATHAETAAHAGIYHAVGELLWYNGSEVQGPFVNGTQTLWEMCTGIIRQPLSTVPLDQNAGRTFFKDIDTLGPFSREEEKAFVSRLFGIAGVDSPLVGLRDWRHVPSESAVCVDNEHMNANSGRARSFGKKLKVSKIEIGGYELFTEPEEKGVFHGPEAYKLGAGDRDCVCGWYTVGQEGKCTVPSQLCGALPTVPPCTKVPPEEKPPGGSDLDRTYSWDNDKDLRIAIEAGGLTSEQWQHIPCPMLAFSDHWGVLPQNVYDSWFTMTPDKDMMMSAEHVLAYGRGGLRLPAWEKLTNTTKRYIKPTDRKTRLYDRVTGESLAGQRFCTTGKKGEDETKNKTPEDVDESILFPVAQIVHASLPIEACSRYVVEALKYKLMTVNQTVADTVPVVLQELLMQRWQLRCKSQGHLISTCEHFGVFEVRPEGYSDPTDCPFNIHDLGDNDYITSGCLVYIREHDRFLDPCRCEPCLGGITFLHKSTLVSQSNIDKCSLPVDPRTLANGWASGVPQQFVEDLLSNVLDEELRVPEGAATDMPPGEHCDGIVDWWPEEWSEPVGYHVTTPCHPDEAGYRVFDNSFAVDRDADGEAATIRHHADALRDPVLKAANFGTCGLCRQTTYGMPLFDINPMRVCTQMPETEKFDPTVPRTPEQGSEWREWKCADSTHDVPWTPQQDPAGPELSAGTMPFFDPEHPEKWSQWDSLAERSKRLFSAGLSREDFPVFLSTPACSDDSDCPVVSGALPLKCLHGVCFRTADSPCTRHDDCLEGYLCSGGGKCEASSISMHNLYNEEVEWQVTANDCGLDQGSFDTLGVSPWGQISNVLDAHGFCSFENWFGWGALFADDTKCPIPNNYPPCQRQASLGVSVNYTWARPTQTKDPTLGELGWLQVKPHACDMDYTRAKDMDKGCFPTSCPVNNRAKWYRTFDSGTMEVIIGLRALHRNQDTILRGDRKYIGFLGLDLPKGERTWEDAKLVRCDSVPQCSSLAFTWDFLTASRQRFVDGKGGDTVGDRQPDWFKDHTDTDTFKCSASMYYDADRQKCFFDPLVVPFYDALCLSSNTKSTLAVCNRRTLVIDAQALSIACKDVTRAYGVDEVPRVDTHVIHNSMFGVFNLVPENKHGYLDAVECALELRAKTLKGPKKMIEETDTVQMTTPTSLYYAYKYSLYELPFSWWFRCSLLSGFRLSHLGSRTTWECKEWDEQYSTNSFTVTFPPPGLSPFDFLRRIGGVYTLEDFNTISIDEQDIQAIRAGIKKALETVTTKRKCFDGATYWDDADFSGNQECWLSDSAYSAACDKVRMAEGTPYAKPFDADLVDIMFDLVVSRESDDSIFKGNSYNAFEHNSDTGEYEMRAGTFDLPVLETNFLNDVVDNFYGRDGEECVKDQESFNDVLLTYRYGYDDIVDDMGGLSKLENDYIALYDNIEDLTSGELMDRLSSIVSRQFDRTFYLGETQCGGNVAPRVKCSPSLTANVCAMDFFNNGRSYTKCLKPKVQCEYVYDPGTYIQLDDYVQSSSRYTNDYISGPVWGNSGSRYSSSDEWTCSAKQNVLDGNNYLFTAAFDYLSSTFDDNVYIYCDTSASLLKSFFQCSDYSTKCGVKYLEWVTNIFPWLSDQFEGNSARMIRDFTCSYKVLAEEDLWIQDYFRMELGKGYVKRRMCSGRTGCYVPTVYGMLYETSETDYAFRRFYSIYDGLGTGVIFMYNFIQWYAKCVLQGVNPESEASLHISNNYHRTIPLNTSSGIFPPSGWDWQKYFRRFDTSKNIAHAKTLDVDADNNIRCSDDTKKDGVIPPSILYNTCGKYNALLTKMKNFVSTTYKADTFSTSGNSQSRDFTRLDVSKQPVAFAWAAVQRKNVHVGDLLDIDAQCAKGSITDSVCTLRTDAVTGRMTLNHVNPWAGGDFNAVLGCDTRLNEDRQQMYNAQCLNTAYCDQWNQHYPKQECLAQGTNMANEPRHTDRAGNNLCTQQAIPETYECTHTQGVLGGGVGERVSDLYKASEFTCPAGGQSIFRVGGLGERGCLQIRGDELGARDVRMELGGDGILRVTKVKLAADVDIDKTLELEEWVKMLHDNSSLDDLLYSTVYGGRSGERDWSEPFQRIAFWTGQHEHAGPPLVPDPARSSILYGHLNLSQHGHPVQRPQGPRTWKQRRVFTKNGFCSAGSQELAFNTLVVKCGLLDTMRVLLESTATVLAPVDEDDNGDLADWPAAGGVLRDGSTLQGKNTEGHTVLNRLPRFNFKYGQNEIPVTEGPFGKTTLSDGGDCHMGFGVSTRAETVDLTSQKCQLVEKTRSGMRFRCAGAPEGHWSETPLPREASKQPQELVQKMKEHRRRCSECSVPDWDRQQFPTESEISFGVPYRFSPVRGWMRAIQKTLDDNVISKLDPASRPDRETFVDEHMRGASSGFGNNLTSLKAEFEKDWLFCKNVSDCKGSIPWATWKPWEGRMKKCFDEMMAQSEGDSDNFVVPIELCDIDSNLDAMCSVLQEARHLIADGNCVASGECLVTPGFYAPAVFSVSNNEFVRVTVQNFYESYHEDACGVDRRDVENLELRTLNAELVQQCASHILGGVKQLMLFMREIVAMVANMVVITVHIMFKILSLLVKSLSAEDLKEIFGQILALFLEFVKMIVDVIEAMGKLLYRVLFDLTGVGRVFRDLINTMCEVLTSVVNVLKSVYCDFVKALVEGLVGFLTWVSDFVERDLNSVCFGNCGFGNKMAGTRSTARTINQYATGELRSWCESEGEPCTPIEPDPPDSMGLGDHPFPTRCWAAFTAQAGMSTQLSCTRSDTCAVESGATDERMVCDSCPRQVNTGFQDYGCDLLTKLCTCKTQYRSITYCTNNEQCSGQDASCLLVEDLFSSASWGVQTCDSCRTDSVCVYDGSQNLGQCTCPLQAPNLLRCTPGQGPDINKGVQKQCLFTFADVQYSNDLGYMSFASLSVVPCLLLTTKALCTVVDNRGGLVVGYEIEATLAGASSARRRLLELEGMDFYGDNATASHNQLSALILDFADWNGTADPCRSLVDAHRQMIPLGPVDVYVLRQCVFWRAVAQTSGMPDTSLLSFQDFLACSVQNVSTPLHLLASVRLIVHNVLVAWPEARAALYFVGPMLNGNNTWAGVLRSDVLAQIVGARENDHRRDETYILKRASMRSLKQLPPAASGETVGEVIAQGVDVKLELYGGLDMDAIDGIQSSVITLDDLESWGVDVGELEYATLQKLARPESIPFVVRSSEFMLDHSGANRDFSAGSRVSSAPGSGPPQQGDRDWDNFPPAFAYWVRNETTGEVDGMTCPVVEMFLDEMSQSFALLGRFYVEGTKRLKPNERTLAKTLPSWVGAARVARVERGAEELPSLPATAIRTAQRFLNDILGLNAESIRNFFSCTEDRSEHNLCNLVKDTLTCNMEDIQLCSGSRRDLAYTILIAFVLFLVAGWILQKMGLVAPSIFVWVLLPAAVMWWAYGYSPICFPMVPMCLPEVIMSLCLAPRVCLCGLFCRELTVVLFAGCVGLPLPVGADYGVPPGSLADHPWVLEQHEAAG